MDSIVQQLAIEEDVLQFVTALRSLFQIIVSDHCFSSVTAFLAADMRCHELQDIFFDR